MVSLSPYRRGNAPVQLVNHTKHFMIEYSEKDNQGRSFLASGESVYYTWLRPEGTRSLVWSLSGQSEEQTNALLSDDHGVIVVGPNRFMSWVSFLDGMQRVLVRLTKITSYSSQAFFLFFMKYTRFYLMD